MCTYFVSLGLAEARTVHTGGLLDMAVSKVASMIDKSS